MKKITAIVVARGGSRRVPGKALRPFAGSTLIGHKIEQLKACRRVDEIVVGSDSQAILNEAYKHGVQVRKRDAYHCDESQCSANEMIRNMVAMVETDIVLWAHPTNPLCGPRLYTEALEKFLSLPNRDCDSLMSVKTVRRHAWMFTPAMDYRPINLDPTAKRHQLAAELNPIDFQDGAIFIQPHEQMLNNAYFYGRNPTTIQLDDPFGFDVDTEDDLQMARYLFDQFGDGGPQ